MLNETRSVQKPRRSRKIVVTDKGLYDVLIRIAKDYSPEEAYPKSISDFAGFIVRQIPNGLNLRLGKFNDIGPSLLVDALRSTTKQKKRLFSPVLLEFAARIYEQPKEEIYPENANSILIKTLQLHRDFRVRQIAKNDEAVPVNKGLPIRNKARTAQI